jgi:5-methylcytosine-specific restriction endonuclease McrA
MRWGRGFECLDCYRAYRASLPPIDFDKSAWRKARGEENHLAEAAYAFGAAAKRRGAPVRETVTPLVVLEEADGLCGICGEDVDPFDYHIDHIVPIPDGGDHCYENVQLAHPSCNVEKGHAERRARAAA